MKIFINFTLILFLLFSNEILAQKKKGPNYRCLNKRKKLTVCIGEKISTLPRKNARTKKISPYQYGTVKKVYMDKKKGNYALIFWKNGRKEKISFKRFLTEKEVKDLKLKARGNVKKVNMLPRF